MAKYHLTTTGVSDRLESLLPFWRRLLLVPELFLIMGVVLVALVTEITGGLVAAIALLTALLLIRIGAMYLAQQLLANARSDQAAHFAWLADRLHPWSADALALRGVIAMAHGNLEDAVTLLRRSIALFPYTPATHAMMSGTLLGLGRVVAARHAAQQAIDLDPHCATAYLYLAEAERMSASPLLEIEDTLRAGLAVAQRPDDSVALRCALAALLLDAERLSEMGLALGGIEHLIEQCSLATRTRLRMRYGELLLAQGQIDRARTYLQETMIVERAAGIASGA